jgi:hypothetical protein
MNETTKAEIRKRLSNITQLQDILLGDKIDEYDHKFEQYNKRLDSIETKARKCELVTEERITQLEYHLSSRIDSIANSLEKKIKYLNSTTKEEQARLHQDLDNVSQNNHKNIDFLQNSLNANTNSLKTEITQAKSALERDMQLLKQQVLEKLESNLTELATDKISRQDLAEVLFELSLELRGTKHNLNLPESNLVPGLSEEHQLDTDLILPESM